MLQTMQNSSPARQLSDPQVLAGRDRHFSPTELSAKLLTHLLSLAHDQLPTANKTIITVPARFSAAQRQATLQAAQMAGVEATLLQGTSLFALYKVLRALFSSMRAWDGSCWPLPGLGQDQPAWLHQVLYAELSHQGAAGGVCRGLSCGWPAFAARRSTLVPVPQQAKT